MEHWLSSRPSSCVSLLWLLGEFPAFLARAVPTCTFGAFFRLGVVSGSHMSCVWVLPVDYYSGFFGRFCGYSCAMLGSTVDTCSATVRFGRFHTHFYVHVNSNPGVFFFVLRLNGEVAQWMPQVAGNLEFAA